MQPGTQVFLLKPILGLPFHPTVVIQSRETQPKLRPVGHEPQPTIGITEQFQEPSIFFASTPHPHFRGFRDPHQHVGIGTRVVTSEQDTTGPQTLSGHRIGGVFIGHIGAFEPEISAVPQEILQHRIDPPVKLRSGTRQIFIAFIQPGGKPIILIP